MMGRPDSEPLKRPAPTSIEDLGIAAETDREQAVGSLGLSWVGIADGCMYADWLTQVADKNEAPVQTFNDPDAAEGEWHFERDDKDDDIRMPRHAAA